jgi:hypothetical protein
MLVGQKIGEAERLAVERPFSRYRLVSRSRREPCAPLTFAGNFVLGYPGPLWSPEDIALLGTIPDEEVAGRTDRTADAVAAEARGVGHPEPRRQPLDG